MSFDEFVERKDAERAERDRRRVSWRKATWTETLDRPPDFATVEGWSGLGPGGRLVYVRWIDAPRSFVSRGEAEYGTVEGSTRVRVGAAYSVPEAQRLAEALIAEVES